MKKILYIIASNGYQDIEYEIPKSILEENSCEVITASSKEIAKGSLGGSTKVDLLIENVRPENYDAIVFAGGPGSREYFDNETALKIAKFFNSQGKLTCAICAGPGILANAEILKDKKSTCFEGISDIIEGKGAIYTGNQTEIDGNIITANGPKSAKLFGELIAQNL